MYKSLLCWKYLRTRFLAFVCIVSVMLGVATLVVVNSVMAGFSTKLKDRFHGLLSDVAIESPSFNGFPIPAGQMMAMIEKSPAAQHIEAMTGTVEVFGMCTYELGPARERVMTPVQIVGIDPKGRAAVGGFSQYFVQEDRQLDPSFDLTPEAMTRWKGINPAPPVIQQKPPEDGIPFPAPPPAEANSPIGAIPGFGITNYRTVDPITHEIKDRPLLVPGDSFKLVTIGVMGEKQNLRPVDANFTVCDSIRTEMTEYDGRFIYVPLDYLQRIRGMKDEVTHIQIRLKDYSKAPEVVAELRKIFKDDYSFHIRTWEDKQSSLLSAVQIERGLLNLLLFMIIGVAGFCILAIFSMIVREKTRDIGILKSLGASNRGILQIFLGYGLLLGTIGSLLGTILGLLITWNINPIEHQLFKMTGVGFDRTVYYFDAIPTQVELMTLLFVNIGAIAIAVTFSVWPALRAAMLRPVQALRFE
jgi:lipoprotein-releasing system permease protein